MLTEKLEIYRQLREDRSIRKAMEDFYRQASGEQIELFEQAVIDAQIDEAWSMYALVQHLMIQKN